MSVPSLRRASWIASVTLVSVLHTSIAAWAQAPAGSSAPTTRGAPAPNAPAANAPAPSAPTTGSAPATAAPNPASSEASVAAVREQARAAYGAGQEAYAAGQYAAAAEHFARADELLPAIQAKYWRAMSLDKQGDVAGTYAALGVVLSDPKKDELGADKLEALANRQRELGAVPADLLVTTTPAGAHVQVSGVDVPTPTPLSLRLAPGRHELVISLPGYETQRVPVTATPGAQLRPNVTLLPQTASTTGPIAPLGEAGALDTTSTPRSLVPGYVTLGIAGAAAIVGTIFGVRALSDKKDYDKNPTAKGADDVERNALIADMAFGVTLTLGVTGIVLLVADDTGPQTASAASSNSASLHLLPYVSPKGAGAAASMSF